MPENDFITIVSTQTIDRVPSADGRTVRDTPGGPAHYIAHALDLLGKEHRLVTGRRALVEAVRHGDEFEYVIPLLPAIRLPPRLVGRAAILSPIMNEIDPANIPPSDGPLVIDLQGFVRRPGLSTGEPGGPVELQELLLRANIVKGSASELARLTPDSRSALSGAVVLETRGAQGATVHVDATATHVAAVPVVTPNPIGAGDTFLAAFVVATLEGEPPVEAARRAARFTESVLARRLTDLQNTI